MYYLKKHLKGKDKKAQKGNTNSFKFIQLLRQSNDLVI